MCLYAYVILHLHGTLKDNMHARGATYMLNENMHIIMASLMYTWLWYINSISISTQMYLLLGPPRPATHIPCSGAQNVHSP